eukprot:362672-Chlamydomonas_euryale.AAC.8
MSLNYVTAGHNYVNGAWKVGTPLAHATRLPRAQAPRKRLRPNASGAIACLERDAHAVRPKVGVLARQLRRLQAQSRRLHLHLADLCLDVRRVAHRAPRTNAACSPQGSERRVERKGRGQWRHGRCVATRTAGVAASTAGGALETGVRPFERPVLVMAARQVSHLSGACDAELCRHSSANVAGTWRRVREELMCVRCTIHARLRRARVLLVGSVCSCIHTNRR